MLTPHQLLERVPVQSCAAETVASCRSAIRRILTGDDNRLLVIAGPCSIHDASAAQDYAERLTELARGVDDRLLLVMRTYLEKPRTTIGWRGFLDDPALDGSCDMEAGLTEARLLLTRLNGAGVPCATESLDPLLAPYLQDLVSWTALGARTSESQVHRAMASGLPMPVGIKNGTDGRVSTAIDGVETALSPQSYVGIDQHGRVAHLSSAGNPLSHVVLRGGGSGPNFEAANVMHCESAIVARGLEPNIVVDCSHANSGKVAKRQLDVLADVEIQISDGNQSIVGVMLESHLFEGNQTLTDDASALRYGVSITDACLGWEDTERAIHGFAEGVGAALSQRQRQGSQTQRDAA